MALGPSKFPHFDSWKKLLQWLPKASESQLMTVFVWAGDQKAPAGDAGWMEAVRNEAYEELVNRTSERLKRFLAQRCHCQDSYLAEDVVQQVFIKVYLRAEQYDPRRSFWGWLYRIARNEHIDALRRQRPGGTGLGGPDQDLEDQVEDRTTPESIALEREQRQRLEEAIAALPTLQREIVRLKLDKITGKEIANRLGISQAYVSQLYHEAEEILGEVLEN